MQISTTGHGLETSEALRAFIEDKLSRMERYCPGMTTIQVILKAEPRGGRSVEVVCRLAGGKSVVCRAAHDDTYAAVDLVADKLQRQLTKVNAQRRERHGSVRELRRAKEEGRLPAAGAGAEKTGDEEETEGE